jgi:glutathione peroxidase-family protein
MLLPMNFRRPEPVDFDTPMQQYINANMGKNNHQAKQCGHKYSLTFPSSSPSEQKPWIA